MCRNLVGALSRVAEKREDLLIQGDNLDSLKAFLPCYAEKVKLPVARALRTPVGLPATVVGVTWFEYPDRRDRSQSYLSPVR